VICTVQLPSKRLSEWVRGRGLALYMTVFFGALSLGSVIWGKLAGLLGLATTHFAAAAVAAAVIPLTWRWKLQTGAGLIRVSRPLRP
jgi:hypothetical protein